MRSEKIEFTGHGGDTLAARLDLPPLGARAFALFAHCFTCGKDIAAARRVSQRLTQAGIGVLRFDFTGLGHSEGEFANTGFRSNVEDLTAACDWLAKHHQAPQLLIGHSLGGAAVLAAAAQSDSVTAVATIAAPADPTHTLRHLGAEIETIRRQGEAEVTLAGRQLRIGRAFVEQAEAANLSERIGNLRKALLVMHAPRDEIVSVDNATEIFLAAKHPKSFVSLDDADHLVSRERDAAYAADVIAAWASRYVSLAEIPHPAAGAGEGGVRAAEFDPDGFLQDIHAGRHHLLADEPASVGGGDQGATPYQLVSAGLAACTAMTIRMVARRRKVPLEHVAVDIEHDKIHAEDCESCENRAGKIDRFRRLIRLSGPLSDEQRAGLMEIADKCPVHRTLESASLIETTEAER